MLRRDFLCAAIASGATLLGGRTVSAGAPEATPSFADFHSHAWRRPDFAADMRRGNVGVAVLVSTADRPLLSRASGRQRAEGTPAPGQLYEQAVRQIAEIADKIERFDLYPVRQPEDIAAARATGRPGAILGYEGGDVLEGRLERVNEIHASGVRLLQLVHFRVNELGDIQTEDAVHHGLTPFGADVVRRCNRLGIVVDVAHATFDTTKQVLAASGRPVVLSHTFLLTAPPRRYTRGITREHARAVAESGGAIGVVPFPNAFPTLRDYADGVARMADAVGVDHVGIGSDMSGIPGRPPFRRYEELPQLLQALGAAGFDGGDLVKVFGGNFARVFAAAGATA